MDWPTILTGAKDGTQALAVVVGGIWTYRLFVKQRLGFERVDTSHEVTCYSLSSHQRLVRVVVIIKNVGNVVLRPPRLTISLQRILPAEIDLVDRAEGGEEPYAPSPVSGNWVNLTEHSYDMADDDFVLEPGEVEKYPFDFTIPSSVRVLQVHSEILCGPNRPKEYWDETTIHDLTRSVA
jgi:hypothetical protein